MLLTSVQNPRVKAVRKLHEPKWRRREGRFLLEGATLVAEAVRSGWPLIEVFATPTWLARHPEPMAAPVTMVSDHVLGAMSTLETPDGLLGVARLPGDAALPTVQPWSLWLVADGIADPGNLGATIRSADAAGADAVLFGPGTTDPFGPKAVRASMGSALHLAIAAVEDLGVVHADTRREGMRWLALEPREGKSLYDVELEGPLALLVGNEAAGLGRAALGAADLVVHIPLPGKAESLNAAAAVAVALFEIVRQRRH